MVGSLIDRKPGCLGPGCGEGFYALLMVSSWFHEFGLCVDGLPLAMKLDESDWLFRVDLHHPIAGRGRHSVSRFRL